MRTPERDNGAFGDVLESPMTIRRIISILVTAIALAVGVAAGIALTTGPALANETSNNGA